MTRCPSCRRQHVGREALAIADRLRTALYSDLGGLRAAARRAALELEGNCSTCTFRLGIEQATAGLTRTRPRLMVVRPLDDDAEVRQ